MKKVFIKLALFIFLWLYLSTQQALAVKVEIKPPPGMIPGIGASPTTLISFILTLLFAIGVFLSIAFIIYGGIKWSTSGGDKIALESARHTVIAAVIGLVVITMSFVIIEFVFDLIGRPFTTVFTLPSI